MKLYQVKVVNHMGEKAEVFYIEAEDIDVAMDRSLSEYADGGGQLPGLESVATAVVASAKEVNGRILR